MKKPQTLLIACGGTGGHILPGVAVADAWKKKGGANSRVLFVGATGGLEEKLVPRAGYILETLHIGSLKKVSGMRRLKTLIQLPWALIESAWILLKVRPKFILGIGGYASGPLLIAAVATAWIWRARVAILEPNSIPGMTNRYLAPWVGRIFTAFPGGEKIFNVHKTCLVGTPTRSTLQPLPPAPRQPFGVFIFGGSQGAQAINTLVIEALPFLKDLFPRLKITHQTGERDFERVNAAHLAAGSHAQVAPFIHDMRGAYADASLCITRAGASTLAELATVRRASILIPLPTSADNHQFKNAQVLVGLGGAELFEQKTATPEKLAARIRALVEDPKVLEAMEIATAALHRPNAADQLIRELTGLD